MSAKVLLIDDSATVRMQARKALGDAGFGIIEAVDGVDAFEKLDAVPDGEVALIVCDVNMPRMDGIEFVRQLSCREGARPPVIMLTTEGHPGLVKAAKSCGAKGWMVKPFKPELLVSAARKITGTRTGTGTLTGL